MTSYITEAELEALQASKLDRATPYMICGVSRSQLSLARYYGRCKYQGRQYFYQPQTDELVRDDVLKWLVKYRKAQRNTKQLANVAEGRQPTLPLSERREQE